MELELEPVDEKSWDRDALKSEVLLERRPVQVGCGPQSVNGR